MSVNGWNPSIAATFEVSAARILANDTSSFADITAGVTLERQHWTFQRRNDVRCTYDGGLINRWGYRLVNRSTGGLYGLNQIAGPEASVVVAYNAAVSMRMTRAMFFN